MLNNSSTRALSDVAQLAGNCSAKPKITGSIPGQGTAWVVGLVPSPGVYETTDQYFSFTSMFLSLSFSLPSVLSKNKYIKSFKNEITREPFNLE